MRRKRLNTPSQSEGRRDRDDRDRSGRFLPGNKAAVGNVKSSSLIRAAELRRMLDHVGPHLPAVYDRLIGAAQRGKPWAVRLVMQRCFGRPAVEDTRAPEIIAADDTLMQRVADLTHAVLDIDADRDIPDEPDGQLIRDAAALAALGLPFDAIASRLGVSVPIFNDWLKEGADEHDQGRRRSPSARLVAALNAASAEATTRLAIASQRMALRLLERLRPDAFGKDALQLTDDIEEYDKDERFI